MSSLFQRLAAAFRPIAYRGYELLIMRVLMSLVILRVMPGGTSLTEQPHPVGLAYWPGIDFSFLADPMAFKIVETVLYVSLAVYCTGRFLFVALPLMLFSVVAIGTLENSQGAATHSTQIVALCLLAQCVWHVYAVIKGRWSDGDSTPSERRLTEGRMAVWLTQQAIAAAYVVSALSKWIAKGDWVRDSSNFPLQIVKSQQMDYYNDLQPPTVDKGDYGIVSDMLRPIADWMEHVLRTYPSWAPLLLAPGFYLELFAFMLLAGRKTGAIFAVLLIFFHLTIAEMMGLNFKFNIYLLVIFFFSVPLWFEWAGRKALGGRKLSTDEDDG